MSSRDICVHELGWWGWPGAQMESRHSTRGCPLPGLFATPWWCMHTLRLPPSLLLPRCISALCNVHCSTSCHCCNTMQHDAWVVLWCCGASCFNRMQRLQTNFPDWLPQSQSGKHRLVTLGVSQFNRNGLLGVPKLSLTCRCTDWHAA